MANLAKLTSTENAEHYSWGENCHGWFLLKDSDMHIIQERMPPGTQEKRHIHNRSRQFYVLRGELTIILEREIVRLRVGEGLEIEPGTAHQAQNNSGDEVEFIATSCSPKPQRPDGHTLARQYQ
ncbi:MAG TPA: cupin domain-containing protein [Candidatus Acidoferrales bacterium]|nr:cupin domain-containing protein [Candidatus Acidoferrales bacterium]